ncbi:MAG: ribose 5-phosphate isomerase B [Flexilinea sp.]|jgi:ribose 5-phosphate isomerase B
MIALAGDHVAVALKEEIKKLLDEMSLEYKDFGTNSTERSDYPIFGVRAAKAVASGECDRGIILCGTGVGIGIAANKIRGIRCVTCSDCYSAKLSRLHNNTNMLSMGARVVGTDLARMIAEIWLTTPFEGGRHQKRVDQISRVETEQKLED